MCGESLFQWVVYRDLDEWYADFFKCEVKCCLGGQCMVLQMGDM